MPDVAGKRVLIFGDSLSHGAGSPGYAMGEVLAQHGAKVSFDARIGRSAWNFFNRENPKQLQVTGFDYVIVELGTNDIGINLELDRARMVQIRDAFAQHAEVWAFGPPSFPKGTPERAGAGPVFDMMKSVFGGKLLDMRPLTNDMTTAGQGGRAADGVHFTAAGGKVVGDRMAQTFLSSSDSGALPMVVALAGCVIAYLLTR